VSERKLELDAVVVVLPHTKKSDLKPGDLVVTAEIMEVRKVMRKDFIECVNVGEQCGFIKHVGWGQQGIMKVVAGARRKK
jgi:hypothetical protein